MIDKNEQTERTVESEENKVKERFYKNGVLVFTQIRPVLKNTPVENEEREISEKEM